MAINSYRDLIVWQKSMQLVEEIYAISSNFPKEEQFGLTNQIKRSAISIPSNIAEGSRKSGKKEYVNFLHHSFGSGAELETQLEIAFRIGILSKDNFEDLFSKLEEVQKMLNSLIRKIA